MKPILVIALCAGTLAACEKANYEVAPETEVASAEAPAADAGAVAPSRASTPPGRGDYSPPTNIPLLAYSYVYRMETPAKAIDPLVAQHEAACRAAGPSVCQVTETSVSRESRNSASGTLSLRARPDWLEGFRAGLAKDAEDAGGRLASSNTATDDLSRSIVDTEAQIRAQVIMRDRLEDLLRNRTGKLNDIVEIEGQLAQVRGEIDAAQSSLAMMKNRVRMSALTITYATKGGLARDGAWAPVAEAVRASQGVTAGMVSMLIYLVAGLAPISALAALIWLGVARFRKQRRLRPDSAPVTLSAP